MLARLTSIYPDIFNDMSSQLAPTLGLKVGALVHWVNLFFDEQKVEAQFTEFEVVRFTVL